jgi:hypothetical protein
MTGELERAVKRYNQWFGSYERSGELVKVQVWLTVNNGCIEFMTLDDSKLSASVETPASFVILALKTAHLFLVPLKS